ncbi:MAG: hypothetical protein IK106_02730 [Clostridiales bacterium]|nr:hypothetical protein [Clostridiales bacterium]
MNRLKRILICVLTLSVAVGMTGCKKSGKFSHSSFKSAAKKCNAEIIDDVVDFAKKTNQLSGYSLFISKSGSSAQSLFESQVTSKYSMPEIKEISTFISMPDEESMCYVSMVTFADEAEANNMYRSNCELVKGNIIGNDGYSYQLSYSEADGRIRQAGAYQDRKTVIYAISECPGSKEFNDLNTICSEMGIKSPAEAGKR